MNHRMESMPIRVLSLTCRDDRRHVAVASAMAADISPSQFHFVDAIDTRSYASADALIHEASKEGFIEFEALWGYPDRNSINTELEDQIGHSPLAYAWSLCRYLQKLSSYPESYREFFIHDDMYPVCYKHFRVERLFVRSLYNYPLLTHANKRKIKFVVFLLSTTSKGLPSAQGDLFDIVKVGTPELDLRSGIFSPYGAEVLLKRLRSQVEQGAKTPFAFLDSLKSVADWEYPGVYSTREPLFKEYPTEFLGSDIRNIPRLQGQFTRLFEEVEPNDR